MPEIWIQLENRPWDTMPNNIDRMNGKHAKDYNGGKNPEVVTITSPTGVSRNVTMYAPLRDDAGNVTDALIFRRYRAPTQPDQSDAWTIPDDRKVNPWDINEHDPTDAGTMGTIPGPVIEVDLQLAESAVVHFRNMDMRVGKTDKQLAHSMHVHGFVFENTSDGAYPLTPPDHTQPITAAEQAAWSSVGVTGAFKMGDRVPSGGTFTYTWKTVGWGATAGAWLYHDHSFCDMDNISLGAIGIVVIHNGNDAENEVLVQDLPDKNVNGNPKTWHCFPLLKPVGLMALPNDLIDLEKELIVKPHPMPDPGPMDMNKKGKPSHKELTSYQTSLLDFKKSTDASHVLQQGEIALAINPALLQIKGFCFPIFKKPPTQALYLLLFHELTNQPGMCINGRTYLGNTPSLVGGTSTRMKFGVVGMGNAFHTFHLHGHRWIIPGASGTTQSAIQGSPQNHAVSQFEDTRTFGPANSFTFFINGASGSFMRAGGPGTDEAKGEWHLHCHVLQHMMTGMMGSLLIVDEGDSAFLPIGTDCGATTGEGTAQHIVTINNFVFSAPSSLPVKMGDTIRFSNIDATAPEGHGVQWLTAGSPANTNTFFNGEHRDILMNSVGTFHYQCLVHGSSMPGVITVTM